MIKKFIVYTLLRVDAIVICLIFLFQILLATTLCLNKEDTYFVMHLKVDGNLKLKMLYKVR